MAYRKVGLEERALWLLQLEAAGWPDNERALAIVSRQRGAPSPRTLKRWWASKDTLAGPRVPSTIADGKRPDFVAAIEAEMQAIIECWPSAREDADYRALMTAFGILSDKRQLLTGQSTSNNAVDIRIRYADPND